MFHIYEAGNNNMSGNKFNGCTLSLSFKSLPIENLYAKIPPHFPFLLMGYNF